MVEQISNAFVRKSNRAPSFVPYNSALLEGLQKGQIWSGEVRGPDCLAGVQDTLIDILLEYGANLNE